MSPEDERQDLALTQIRSLGARALATAHCMSASVRLAPTITLKRALLEYSREELERFSGAAMLFEQRIDGGELLQEIREQTDRLPAPASWLEVIVMQLCFDSAGRLLLGELAMSSDLGLANLASAHLEGGTVHATMAAEAGNALRNSLLIAPEKQEQAQAAFELWLGHALRSFGRPNSERGKRAVELGLKPRPGEAVIADYIDGLKTIAKQCNLQFPTAEGVGIELPPGLLPN